MIKCSNSICKGICSIFGLMIALVFLLTLNVQAAQVVQTLPFYDSFDYNPGGLAGSSFTVWETCFSTANISVAPGTNSSLTLPGYVTSAGSSVGGSSKAFRFAGTQFSTQTASDGQTVYASFLYQVVAYPTTSPGVIAFLDATNIGTSSSAPMPGTTALALLVDHTGHIGINAGAPSATGAQFETSSTPTNAPILIVARYTFHTSPNKDVVDLWVNPSSSSYGGTAPAPDKTVTSPGNWPSLADFTISCNGSDSTLAQKWDEVRIGTTWAQAVPSSNVPGPASAAHSLMVSATPTSVVADGASTSVVKMQSRDIHGVNLTAGGSTVIFTTTAGTLSGTTDNGDGTYQATLTAPVTLGTATVTATLGGLAIATNGTATNSPSLKVSFLTGPVSASASTAVANPTAAAADGVTASTITIAAMDSVGHPLSNQVVTLNVSGSGNIVSTPAPTSANGQTTATLASTVGETKTITVTIGGTQINAQPTVTFTSGGVSAFNSTAIASPNMGLTADGVSTSTITVTAIDGAGHAMSGQVVTLSVSGSGNTVSTPADTDVNGQTTATLKSTVAETKTITVSIAGTTINAHPTVTFVPGAATQIAFTTQPVTTPVNVTLPAVVVQIEDQYGNAVAQSGATVTLALNSGTLSGTNPQITDANGKATFNDLSIPTISSGLYLTASVNGFNSVQSSTFNAPPKIFYKVGTTGLNLPAGWTSVEGGPGPAGPPAADGIGDWDTNSSGGTMDVGTSASWYGIVIAATGALTISDATGGHTLTLGAGSFDGSAAVHSVTMSNNVALSTDQTWKWTASSFTLTLAANLDNGGHSLTINGLNAGAPEKFNGAITGNGGLILIGNAAVTLSGTNTYSGNTVINGGKLVLNTNGSIANSAVISLSSNTTFDVSAATPFTVTSGQTLSSITTGTGTATINASVSTSSGNVTLAPGAQAAFTAAYNAVSNNFFIGNLKVLGGVTFNGNAIDINVTGAPLPTGTYTLMTATNGFTLNSSLPTPIITGQGLVNIGAVPQIITNGTSLQLVVSFGTTTTGITNNCGDTAIFTVIPAYGATSYQWYNPSLQPISGATSTTLTLPNTHPSDSGVYQIIATGPGFSFTNSVVLLTVDTAPPTIILNGSSTVLVMLGSPYTELGAAARDACSGNSLTVTTNGSVNSSIAGEYDITYSATTDEGVPGNATRSVIVFDPTAVATPISMNLDFGAATDINGSNPINIPAGWSLLAYGDLNQHPNIEGSPSFLNPDGHNPSLTLSFGNISGWSTASSEFTGADSSTVMGISTNGFINYGSKGSGLPATFTLSGVPVGECVSIYAVDGWDGSGNAPVIIFGGQTNTVTANSFDTTPSIGEFQYIGTEIATNGSVSGSWTGIGGPFTEGQIGGMIIKVQSIPLNNLTVSPASTTVQCGGNITFTAAVYGLPPISYQWYDNNTNPIPGATNANYTLLDPNDGSFGNYTVVAQNGYNTLTNYATITEVLHTAEPVFSLNGANPVNLLVNSPYSDAGATAFDLCAQAYLSVTSNSTVNTSVPGTYSVTYFATTADGTPGSLTRTVIVSAVPNFGANVLIFDPTMTNIQSQIDSVFAIQKYNQFGPQRYALLFKPGTYNDLNINVGYYTELLGLGFMPDDTLIPGYIHSDGVLVNENATQNFWRSAENFAVSPTNTADYMMWAVSQGTALRRMHIEGNLDLANFTDGNFSSGGFLADSKVDATISSLSQQQWLCRNDLMGAWSGGVWNMVFVGVTNPPAGTWPTKPITTVTNTPLIAEKPYLYLDTNGNYNVMVPALETSCNGITWSSGPTPGISIPINQFYIANPEADNASSINAALSAGLNLVLTPGVYQLSSSIVVTHPDTVILGLGYPTLIPQNGSPALSVADVKGVKVAGLLFDAGPVQSPTLMQVGSGVSSMHYSEDPICLYDIFMRVGGPEPGTTLSCVQIDANDVIGDNFWLWRADHGNGVGWYQNICNNGLIVNGDHVTMYGLFVEHEQQYETLWNGNWGRLYFYQSELPYDPPSQAAWSHDGENGYASYKVADQVTSHQAYGLGVYAVFIDSTNISCDNAIETPTNSQQVNMHDMITVYIAGNTGDNGVSALYHVINGTGATIAGPGYGGTATVNCIWPYPNFSICTDMSKSNAIVTFPSESWHSYQLQYKNDLLDPAWLNLGSPIGGNDVLKKIIDPSLGTNRFYRVDYQ